MSKPDRVTAIVLNWNRLDDTVACCRSLQQQTHQALDIWVVDNGSTENTGADLMRSCTGTTVIRLPHNVGFAAGNNAALRAALEHKRPAAFWLLNNDAVAKPDTLQHMVDCLASDSHIGTVGSVICDAHPPHHLQAWGGGWVTPWLGIPLTSRSPGDRLNYLCGASMLIRASTLEQVGLLDEGFFFYFEDVDYSFRLRNAGWKLAVAPKAHVLHKGGGTIGTQNEQLARLYRKSLIRFLRKHSHQPFLTAMLSTGLRIGIASLRRQNGVIRGTLIGWREGWQAPLSCDT